MAALNQQQTFLEIQTAVAEILFNNTAASTTSYPTTSRIKALINKWYKYAYSQKSCRYLWNTGATTVTATQNVQSILMPDDVMEVTNMNIRSLVRQIRPITRQLFLNKYPGGWTTITPSTPLWFVEAPPASNNALQFDLWPMPDSAYTINIDYYKRPAVLSADGDYPTIPPEFDMFLIYGPAMEGLIMLGDKRADIYKGLLDDLNKNLWLRNEQMAANENLQRSLADENIGGSYPGLLQPYIGS